MLRQSQRGPFSAMAGGGAATGPTPRGRNPVDCIMRRGRVLLADCHLAMLQGVRSLLESRFAAVVMVADEGSLLEAIERLDPDLVIVDLSMPVQEGANIARRLRGRYPGLRMLVLSVHDEPTVASLILEIGASGFVLKRTAATDLVPAVEAVLQGGTYVSPAVSTRVPALRDEVDTSS
jgi:DNA-binding NarL/FixJ family response regulator